MGVLKNLAVALSVLLLSLVVQTQHIGQRGDRVSRFPIFEEAFRQLPGLRNVAQGVRGIISATRDTVEKIVNPVSVNVNVDIGRPKYNQENINPHRRGPNVDRERTESPFRYPEYEPLDNEPQQVRKGIVTHADNTDFPIILLHKNEIRR